MRSCQQLGAVDGAVSRIQDPSCNCGLCSPCMSLLVTLQIPARCKPEGRATPRCFRPPAIKLKNLEEGSRTHRRLDSGILQSKLSLQAEGVLANAQELARSQDTQQCKSTVTCGTAGCEQKSTSSSWPHRSQALLSKATERVLAGSQAGFDRRTTAAAPGTSHRCQRSASPRLVGTSLSLDIFLL